MTYYSTTKNRCNTTKCCCDEIKDYCDTTKDCYYEIKFGNENLDTLSIMNSLLKFKNKKIQIITQATPPAGKPPNITGTLIYVDKKILKLRLKSESDGSIKEGIYFLKSILGFIPLGEEDSGGCEKETNPLTSAFSESIGKRVNLLVSSSSSTSSGTNVTGTVLEVTNDFLKIQLDQTTATTNPLIATYPLTQIVGIVDLTSSKTPKGNSSKGKGSKGKGSSSHHSSESETSKGEITVQVTVNWIGDTIHPDEVNIKFIRDDIATTIRTINQIATFSTKPTGDLIIQGESIPGFIVPIKEIKITPSLPFVYETLTYSASTIPVTGITLSPTTLSLLPTDTSKLTATVLPLNASNQVVTWESDNPTVANVDFSGVVTAYQQGIATISAMTAESYYTATTSVTVAAIQSIISPPSISAVLGEVVILPSNVSALLSNGSIISLPVTWMYNEISVGSIFTIESDSTLTIYTLIGTLDKTDLTTTLNINVDTSSPIAIPVTGLTLNTISTSIYVGSSIDIEPIITPDNATTKDVLWSSLDNSIATVDNNGTVTGVAPGLTVITATTVDGNFEASCQVSVSSVPEIDLIYSIQTVYDTREEVVINIENLVAARVLEDTIYYIKVEQTGSSPLLGSGQITLTQDSSEFNLYAFTNFSLSDNFNNEYFVFMSTDSTFPKSDEQTLSTNFKIEPAVPTVPTDNIQVDLSIIDGPIKNPSGITFILAREIDKDIADITWQDYAIDPTVNLSEVQFTDEVKLKGKTNSRGIVEWETPKEPLKLGGYVLLEVTPDGYIDNLNLVNPESSDGELIKVVQLTRDDIIIRHIINTFIG
ncbi:Ig-like domain-containing protein [Romboutsia sp.]|uniref:Ig-like domain-containing protein n=1 Tax=Romboutsia sp. TaxID=1965302 RepID=UPI002CB92314|nr:Ig-like domain-containing protein [Romboutsia sp.]HSQ88868.1 Ig-like domain-containing protein [Romboutsia sp.]